MIGFYFIVIFICLLLSYTLWQYFELKKFSVSKYEILSDKLVDNHRIAVLADLHGFQYGRNNEKLIIKINEIHPEAILIVGDMVVSKKIDTFYSALNTLEQLVRIAPVYYAFGNHESKALRKKDTVKEKFEEYKEKVEELGVKILLNENIFLNLKEDTIGVAGLEIPLNYYKKGKVTPMDNHFPEELLGNMQKEFFQILMAHNPMYSPQYAFWGADLTFCGHNHGGLIRFPGGKSIMSPQLTFFPEYNAGLYEINNKKIIVSRGLGTHTFHVRIFNRAEILEVRLFSKFLEKNDRN